MISGGEGFKKGSALTIAGSKGHDGGDVVIEGGSTSSDNGSSGSVSITSPKSDYGSGDIRVKGNGKTDIAGTMY
jgi:hypothetical protein